MSADDGESGRTEAAGQSTADDLLVEALARGRSQAEAAQLARLSKRTVARRVADPGFARRVSQRRGDVIDQLAGQLAGLADDAIAAIRDVLVVGRPADQLRAAQLVLHGMVSLRRDGELEVRLREIEAALEDESGSEVR